MSAKPVRCNAPGTLAPIAGEKKPSSWTGSVLIKFMALPGRRRNEHREKEGGRGRGWSYNEANEIFTRRTVAAEFVEMPTSFPGTCNEIFFPYVPWNFSFSPVLVVRVIGFYDLIKITLRV